MNPGIFYLYEYENNRRKRNVGFIKISRRYQTCILQIHVRGISVGNGASLELYAFYRNGNAMTGTRIATLNCFGKSVSARLPISERFFPEGRPLSEIDGFIIKLPGQGIPLFWMASALFFPADISMLQPPSSSAEKEPEEEILPDLSETPESSPAQESSDGIPALENPDDIPSFESSDNVPSFEEPDNIPSPEDAGNAAAPVGTDTTADTEAIPSPEMEDVSVQDVPEQADRKKARKIQRSDLSVLPRRFWFLANNSFLLHGYHNYNHLLLAEEKGRLWLGVPGIYDPREAKAADLFGFPQFTREYASALNLEPEEQSPGADFGYWCRCVGAGKLE